MKPEISPMLADANAAFAARDWQRARSIAQDILNLEPKHYWAQFMVGNACDRLGDKAAAVRAWRDAIRIPVTARLGAYFYLLRHHFRERDLSEAALVDEALELSEVSSQRRWYHAQLLFLSGVRFIAVEELSQADSAIEAAYRFSTDIDESDLVWEWTLDILRKSDLTCLPYLRYLARSADAREEVISYDDVLASLPTDTHALEIGAMDGIRFDHLRRFITTCRWPAILVEPTADMFDSLVRNYTNYPNARCVRAAITDQTGNVMMNRIRPDAIGSSGIGMWALGVSSISTQLIKHYPDAVYTESVPALSFDDLVEQEQISRIDLLQVDTEGHDWIVFKQVDLAKWAIQVVYIEVVHLDPIDRLRVFDKLSEAHYEFYFDGRNVIGRHLGNE